MKTAVLALALTFLTAACAQEKGADTEPEGVEAMTGQADAATPADDSDQAIEQAANAFRLAIVDGDSLAMASLVVETATILEGGRTETRDHYLSGHFHSDGAFLSAMTREPIERTIHTQGPVAWVVSVTRLHGAYRDRAIDLNSAELLVLKKEEGHWKVAAVHWSSRPNA